MGATEDRWNREIEEEERRRRTRNHYDPELQHGVDWNFVWIIGLPFLVVCAVVVVLL